MINNLKLDYVELSFGKNKILSNVNLTCTTGEILAIFGKNGSARNQRNHKYALTHHVSGNNQYNGRIREYTFKGLKTAIWMLTSVYGATIFLSELVLLSVCSIK